VPICCFLKIWKLKSKRLHFPSRNMCQVCLHRIFFVFSTPRHVIFLSSLSFQFFFHVYHLFSLLEICLEVSQHCCQVPPDCVSPIILWLVSWRGVYTAGHNNVCHRLIVQLCITYEVDKASLKRKKEGVMKERRDNWKDWRNVRHKEAGKQDRW
jgi:hypothetical protein